MVRPGYHGLSKAKNKVETTENKPLTYFIVNFLPDHSIYRRKKKF